MSPSFLLKLGRFFWKDFFYLFIYLFLRLVYVDGLATDAAEISEVVKTE